MNAGNPACADKSNVWTACNVSCGKLNKKHDNSMKKMLNSAMMGLVFQRGKLRLLLMLLTPLVFLSSCLKNDMAQNDGDKMLTIVFNGNTIPVNLVDSGFVIYKKQNSAAQIYKRLEKIGDRLQLGLEDLNAGSWTAEIYLNTKKDQDGNSAQYFSSHGFAVEQISGISMPGPSNNQNALWKKRYVISNDDNSLVIVIPYDPIDPYLFISRRDPRWNNFQIERAVYFRNGGMNQLLNSKLWNCSGTCLSPDGLLANTSIFSAFAEQNQGSLWNNADVSVVVKDNTTLETREWYLAWDK